MHSILKLNTGFPNRIWELKLCDTLWKTSQPTGLPKKCKLTNGLEMCVGQLLDCLSVKTSDPVLARHYYIAYYLFVWHYSLTVGHPNTLHLLFSWSVQLSKDVFLCDDNLSLQAWCLKNVDELQLPNLNSFWCKDQFVNYKEFFTKNKISHIPPL